MELGYIPWFAWIAIAGIIGGISYQIVVAIQNAKTRRVELSSSGELREVVERNTAVSTELLGKLGSLDARLAAVEKTLTDIP
ncbi:hypothetical protein GCM10022381_36040 [Leifsonia kafniensis]|uniref:DUF2746 domain-containing protein n=1 Tax=Leifsonia kafniensis TaxID=475957 RepID=A0ABP7KY39_9MICO